MKLILRSACTVFFLTLPVLSHATITIDNKTDKYLTAYVKSSPCSSKAGDRGIVKPHGKLKFPSSTLYAYCGFSDCEAHAFMNDHCGDPEVASAIVSVHGVSSIENKDKKNYLVEQSGDYVTISPIKKTEIKSWLSHFFNYF